MPRHRWCRLAPKLPNSRVSSATLQARRSAQVFTPRRLSFAAVTLPTPKIFFTGSAATKASTSCGRTTNWPSGLFQSLATLAMNLLGAMPAEAVMPTSARMRARISCAISEAEPRQRSTPVTSR